MRLACGVAAMCAVCDAILNEVASNSLQLLDSQSGWVDTRTFQRGCGIGVGSLLAAGFSMRNTCILFRDMASAGIFFTPEMCEARKLTL